MRKRCPNGSRKNKKGECIVKSLIVRRRCPNGTRRKGKRGDCIKYVKSNKTINDTYTATLEHRDDIRAKRHTAEKAKKFAKDTIRIAMEATKDRQIKQAVFSKSVDVEKRARTAAKEAITIAHAAHKAAKEAIHKS